MTCYLSTGVDVASNSALNQPPTASAASLETGNDLPFRRQHFDRNSVLRHSKKRRKSSSAGSTTNSPNKAVVAPIASAAGDRDTSTKKVEAEKQPVNFSNNNNDRTQRRSSSQQGLKILIFKKHTVTYLLGMIRVSI